MASAAFSMAKDRSSVPVEPTQNGQWLLQVSDLRKHFPIRKGFLKREVGSIRAVDDVSFYINEGETLSLVGERNILSRVKHNLTESNAIPQAMAKQMRSGNSRTPNLKAR
jgi:ABC-type microcin C transport system duplicated ATPase subunit YejF